DFHLDEYQVALIRAKAVEDYWRNQVGIATAVLDYASDQSAGRATEATTRRALAESLKAYEEAMTLYSTVQEAVQDAGSVARDAHVQLEAAGLALEAAIAVLEVAEADYAAMIEALTSDGNDTIVLDELFASYQDLIRTGGLFPADGDVDEAALVLAHLDRAALLANSERLVQAGEALRTLVSGIAGIPSLGDLAAFADAVFVPPDAATAPLETPAYGIDEHNPASVILSTLLAGLEHAAGATDDQEEKDASVAAYRVWVSLVAGMAKASADAALSSRLDAITLLAATDGAAWYADRTGGSAPSSRVALTLRRDVESAMRAVLEDRAGLELSALAVMLGHLQAPDATARAVSLVETYGAAGAVLTQESIQRAYDALRVLVSSLELSKNDDPDEFAASLEAIAASDSVIASFVNG
ncbi:MAG: hypothetical protein JXM71_10145, partial [Spirochaetales bacterium]|nr:hypothetical protein [Spirochaetales bacterium]